MLSYFIYCCFTGEVVIVYICGEAIVGIVVVAALVVIALIYRYVHVFVKVWVVLSKWREG